MGLAYVKARVIGENDAREYEFSVGHHSRNLGLPQEDIKALGLYNARVEESTAIPTSLAKGILQSKYVDDRAASADVPFVTYLGPSDVPPIRPELITAFERNFTMRHVRTQAGERCSSSIVIVTPQRRAIRHGTQAINLPIWIESRRSEVAHVSLAATERSSLKSSVAQVQEQHHGEITRRHTA